MARRLPRPVSVSRSFTTSLEAERLWDIISGTNTLNRAIGLPHVQSKARGNQTIVPVMRVVVGKGRFKLTWDEYPFEWVKGRFHEVYREFQSIFIRSFLGGVKIEEIAHQGEGKPTEELKTISVYASVVAGSWVLRPLVSLLLPFAVARAAKYLKRSCDQSVSAFKVFRRSNLSSPVNHRKLVDAIQALESLVDCRKDLVKLLDAHLRQSNDKDVVAMRPYVLADYWGQNRDDVLLLFLQATRLGILSMQWSLMCPNCRIPKATQNNVANIGGHFACDFCNIEISTDFASVVELQFDVHENIRHANSELYCIGSPEQFPHIVSQIIVPAGGKKSVVVPPMNGTMQIRCVRTDKKLVQNLQPNRDNSGTVAIQVHADGLDLHGGYEEHSSTTMNFINESDQPQLLRIEHVDLMSEAFTGLAAVTHPYFRAFFNNQVFASGQNLRVSRVSMLFTDLKNSTRSYLAKGDSNAYAIVAKHFEFIAKIVSSHHGSVVKTIGDAVMAAFIDDEEALAAALEIQEKLSEFNSIVGASDAITLKVGVHTGPAIVVNANGVNDFFGTTVNLAVRLQDESKGSDIVVSQEVVESGALDKLISRGAKVLRDEIHITPKGFDTSLTATRLLLRDQSREFGATHPNAI